MPQPAFVPVSRTDVGQACGTYVDFAGNIGIGGTPVIDPVSQTMYLRRTHEGERHLRPAPPRLDIRDGTERPGSPLLIQASVPGTGDGRDAQNNIAFNAAHREPARGPAARSRHGLHRVGVVLRPGPVPRLDPGLRRREPAAGDGYNTTPDGGLGGIWQSGRRPGGRRDRQPLRAHRQRLVQRRRRRQELRQQLHQGQPGRHAARLVYAVQLVVPECHRRRSRHPERAAHPEHQPDRRRRQRRRDVRGRPRPTWGTSGPATTARSSRASRRRRRRA